MTWERNNLDHLRLIIDGYQGTCVPLNRTSLRALFDEIEALRTVAEPAQRLVACAGDDWQEIMQEVQNAAADINRAREAHRTGDVVSLEEFNRTINL